MGRWKQCYHRASNHLAVTAPVYQEQAIMKIGFSELPQELSDSWQTGWSGPGQNDSNTIQSQMSNFGIPEEAQEKAKEND
jgi:hypothetical protein